MCCPSKCPIFYFVVQILQFSSLSKKITEFSLLSKEYLSNIHLWQAKARRFYSSYYDQLMNLSKMEQFEVPKLSGLVQIVRYENIWQFGIKPEKYLRIYSWEEYKMINTGPNLSEIWNQMNCIYLIEVVLICINMQDLL